MSWNDFLRTCIMGGCDYLNSVDKVGLKTVLKEYKKESSCSKIIEAWK